MDRTLFLAWQDPEERRWYTVGRLDYDQDTYQFSYTNEAVKATHHGFTPIVSFPDLEKTYESSDLFPLFANQVLPPSRPEYDDFVEWLSVPKQEADPVAILARAGERMTDTLEIFPYPTKEDQSTYTAHFFVHGLRHQSPDAIERAQQLTPDEPLYLMKDVQNKADPDAVVLRTVETTPNDLHMVGYLPRYLADQLKNIGTAHLRDSSVHVVRVNPSPAPIHFRVLCRLTMHWPPGKAPFDGSAYQPIDSVPEHVAQKAA